MKIYRGPSSKPFYDISHELVSSIKSEDLTTAIGGNKDINFNITKDGSERQAICTVKFDEDDVAAMVIGAVVLQKRQKYALSKIKEALYGTDDSDKKKLGNLKKIIRTIEF